MKYIYSISLLLLCLTAVLAENVNKRGSIKYNGERCTRSVQCYSYNCENGRCRSQKSDGARCYKNSNCKSNFCFRSLRCASNPLLTTTSSLQFNTPNTAISSDISVTTPAQVLTDAPLVDTLPPSSSSSTTSSTVATEETPSLVAPSAVVASLSTELKQVIVNIPEVAALRSSPEPAKEISPLTLKTTSDNVKAKLGEQLATSLASKQTFAAAQAEAKKQEAEASQDAAEAQYYQQRADAAKESAAAIDDFIKQIVNFIKELQQNEVEMMRALTRG